MSHTNLNKFRRYSVHINIGTDRRGTAILPENISALSKIQRLPLGRRMSATFRGILSVNIYAPSGAEKGLEREAFYNTEVVHVIISSSTAMILAGDFNCVITNNDRTGEQNYRRALARFIQGLDFIECEW